MDLVLVLLLAQTCVAEISFQESADECFVMWEINARTARRRGVDLATHTRRYNAYWKVEHTSRKWIGELALDGRRPANWPDPLIWEKSRPRWEAYCAAARRFLAETAAGTYRPRCRLAGAYGGTPGDGVGADDPIPCAGARRVQCGRRHLQAYWNITACSRARRNRGRLRAAVAAGKRRTRSKPDQIPPPPPAAGGAARSRRPARPRR